LRQVKKGYVILGAALLVAAIFALIVPMWVATAGIGMPAAGWGAVILMVIFCFAVGGGLMFLIFYSARKGYDERVDHGRLRDHGGRDVPPGA
jgi:hypothetical protein